MGGCITMSSKELDRLFVLQEASKKTTETLNYLSV